MARAKMKPATKLRLDRYRRGVSLLVLAVESDLSMGLLSEAERGLRNLSADQEKARRDALERLTHGRKG